MSGEVVEEKIPWLWIVPLIIVLPFLNIAVQYFYPGIVVHVYDLGAMGYLLDFNGVPGIITIILLLFYRFGRKTGKRISDRTLVYLFTAGIISTACAGKGQYYLYMTQLTAARYSDSYGLAKYIPYFWMPSREAVATFRTGGPVSPEWIPSIVFWSVLYIVAFFAFIGFSTFLRHQWIDVENLTYPYAHVTIESIDALREPSGSRANKYLIGALIGFLVFLPVTIRQFIKWFPDIYGWFNTVAHDVNYMGTLRPCNVMPSLYRSVVGITQITYNPFYVAIAYLMPLQTLLSASFFYITIILIGAQIAFAMGYYTGIDAVVDGSRSGMIRNMPPLKVTGFADQAMGPAIITFAILLNWRSVILRPLKAAFGSLSDREKEIEKMEPVSYRTAFIMIVVCSLVFIAMLAISGFTVDDSFIFWFMVVVFILANMRIRGYTTYLPVGERGNIFFRWKYPGVTMSNIPQSYYLYGVATNLCHGDPSPIMLSNLYTFDLWRMGAAFKVSNKSIFKVAALTAIVASFIGNITLVWVYGTFGAALSAKGIWDPSTRGTPSWVNSYPSHPMWPWLVAAFLLVGFLSIMHSRFTWWPLEPVGAFIATGGPGVKIGLGWVFIIAFIIKYVTLKVGGSKAYTETGAPIAVGFAIGVAFTAILGMILAVVSFVRPF